MDKFDRYYKSKNLSVNEKLVNRYAKYDNKTLLISNGFGVIYTKTIRNDFKEMSDGYSNSIKRYYDNFSSKENELMLTLDIENIKSNLDDEKHYRFSKDYCLDYTQLKKIIDIIGYGRISVLSRDNFDTCFIQIIGKNNQVGYLLPCRVY